MDSLDGLRFLIVNCMQERGEDPPGLSQFITPAKKSILKKNHPCNGFHVHSNVREAHCYCSRVDRPPDKVHPGADKDVKDETLIRFGKAGIPERESIRKKRGKSKIFAIK